jgi:hypothetical protein
MQITEALLFLSSHRVRTGMTMEWFEFSPGESQYALKVLAYIKSNFSHVYEIEKARIGAGDQNKSNLGFGLTIAQYQSILTADQNQEEQNLPTQQGIVSAYEAQMDFIHFYIINRLEIDELFKQQKLEVFFRNNPQYNDYKDRVFRIKTLEDKQQVLFTNRFLDIPLNHIDDSLRIGYYPYEQIPHKKYYYTPDQITLAPDSDHADYRDYSKHRLVYGPVDFYLTGKKPITFNVISACGPNLMGTSPKDEQTYLDSNRNLNIDQYTQSSNELADFIVSAAKEHGDEKLIMPAFGVGVYIKNVPKDQKPEAVRIMYQAFANAALKFQINVDWIVWSREKNIYLQKSYLDNLKGSNLFMHNVPHDDMLIYAAEQVDQDIQCAVLNAGSDRTIGGKFIAKNPKTVEEQLAHQSDLVLLQTVYNLKMIYKFISELDFAINSSCLIHDITFGQLYDSSDDFDPTMPYQTESDSEEVLVDGLSNSEKEPIKPYQAEITGDSFNGAPHSEPELVNIPTISEIRLYQKQQRVESILAQFKNKIDTIGIYKPQAKTVALGLLADLQNLTRNTFEHPTQYPLTSYAKEAKSLIIKAIPDLQKDLGWGDYLANMIKQLVNSLTWGASFGTYQGFFEIKSSNAAQNAGILNHELDSIVSLNK